MFVLPLRLSITAAIAGPVLIAGIAFAGTAAAASTPLGPVTQPSVTTTGSTPCGTLTSPPTHYQHVIVLMEENLTYSSFQSMRSANPSPIPYTDSLASSCGSETFMHAATHPSQPNYMAASSGDPTGVGVYSYDDNIFHQAQVAGNTWRDYAGGMTTNCGPKNTTYKPGHTPAFWYKDLRSPKNTCKLYDVPEAQLFSDIANNSLPTYAWISPDECSNFYWVTACGGTKAGRFARGDAYLQNVMEKIIATPSYQSGNTVIFVTWDEGNETAQHGIDCTDPAVYIGGNACQIPTIVVSPYITPGATDNTDQNLYSLLGTTEDILGYPRLGRAATTATQSMRPGLGF
jgi:phosphatidylinositol-3-phosphatase